MLIELLPESVAVLLPELSLILIGYVVEKHFVSRVTCFTNVMALNVHFLTIGASGLWLGLYADLGLILGAYGLLAYWKRESLDSWFYNLSHVGYSSIVVGSIILYPHIEWLFSLVWTNSSLPASAIVGLAILLNFALLDEADQLHYRFSQTVGVNKFILGASIRIPTDRGWSEYIDLDEWFNVK